MSKEVALPPLMLLTPGDRHGHSRGHSVPGRQRICVCVFVGFHALFCSNSEKYSDSGGELSLQRRTGMGGARLTPHPGSLQAVLWFLAGQALQTGQQALGSVPSWRAWRPAEEGGQERRPLRAGLCPTVGLLGDQIRSSLRTLWGHFISILDTLSSIKKIPKGWKLC